MMETDWTRSNRKSKGRIEATSIPIGTIVANYGGEVREGKAASVKCCLHSDSRRSAVINTYDNLYYCHTCGKGGNSVSIVCILENLEFKDGLKRAIEIAAGSGATLRSGDKSRGTKRARRSWDF